MMLALAMAFVVGAGVGAIFIGLMWTGEELYRDWIFERKYYCLSVYMYLAIRELDKKLPHGGNDRTLEGMRQLIRSLDTIEGLTLEQAEFLAKQNMQDQGKWKDLKNQAVSMGWSPPMVFIPEPRQP